MIKLKAAILSIGLLGFSTVFGAQIVQNQIGFLPEAVKQVVLRDGSDSPVIIKDQDGNDVLSVTPTKENFWTPANESTRVIDFSTLKKPGTYLAYQNGELISHEIIINDNAYESVVKASLKFFYFQRSSTELTAEFAGDYARAAGHLDTAVLYHAGLLKDPSLSFNGAKGWYDAGDYGKYITNSGITTYTLLQLYRHNKKYFDTLSLHIPESKNGKPDILDEIKWNLDWMLTMQDEDGGVFHKLTTKKFSGTVMPANDKAARYAIGKSTTATLNFAAVMALAADVFLVDYQDKEYSDKCAEAAGKAFLWAKANPYELFEQPTDVNTGTYADNFAKDEFIWASAELYRISRNEIFLNEIKSIKMKTNLPGWNSTYALGAYTIITNPLVFGDSLSNAVKEMLLSTADDFVAILDDSLQSGYAVPLNNGDFYWGSNSVVANKGMYLLHAYYVTENKKYLNSAVALLDYLLGRNPLDVSYLTGFGVNQVMNPHHRPSEADGIIAPVPGMLAGGPHNSGQDISSCKSFDYRDSLAPAKSFYDNKCSYATNEVAINWNAPFAYLAGSLQAIALSLNTVDLTSIQKVKQATPAAVSSQRLIVRNNKVELQKKTNTGKMIYYNLHGARVK